MPSLTLDAVLTDLSRSLVEARPTSGHLVLADAAAPEGADGAARPTELVLAALASCTAMDVAAILRKKRQRASGYRLHVEAELATAAPRVFRRVVVEHRLSGPVDPEALRRAVELSATKYCPVSRMLSASVVIEHRYRLAGDGDEGSATLVVTTGPGLSQAPEAGRRSAGVR